MTTTIRPHEPPKPTTLPSKETYELRKCSECGEPVLRRVSEEQRVLCTDCACFELPFTD